MPPGWAVASGARRMARFGGWLSCPARRETGCRPVALRRRLSAGLPFSCVLWVQYREGSDTSPPLSGGNTGGWQDSCLTVGAHGQPDITVTVQERGVGSVE